MQPLSKLALTAAIGACAARALAHHSFAAEFDMEQPIKLRGTVTEVEFINPHSWIHIDVRKDDGTVEKWAIEGGTPNTLFRMGINQNSLKAGTEIVVDGYRSRDGENRANGRDVTLPDGRKLFLGGGTAGTAAMRIAMSKTPGASIAIATHSGACLLLLLATTAFGQSAGGARPNFSGIWRAATAANWDLEPHAAEPGPVPSLGTLLAVPPGPGVVVGGSIPYLPAALEHRNENRKQRWTADPEIKCFMPGVPRANYLPYPFQIVQGSDTIMMTYEFADAVRTVYLKDPGPVPANSWMGWNVGHWDGNTLVIDVTAQHDDTWLDRSGNHHSNEMHVVERYTLRSPDVIQYEATIEDPAVFSKPWTIRMPLYRDTDENARLMDFKCIPFAEPALYDHIGR